MSVISAVYFDGKSSLKHPVSIVIAKGRMKVVGRDVDLDLDARRVRRSLRVADTPRWLYLPGGGACVTSDNDAVDRATRTRRYERLLHRWESRPAYALLAVALVAVTAWLLLDYGLPAAAEQVAEYIPLETEASLGRQTLQGLDQQFMRASKLPTARQAGLRARFTQLLRDSGETTPYELEFRASPVIGPNAFALPSGIIVVTDELVKLARRDEEILGVLAHELGHVRHRHSMRRLLESSATALVLAGITGDVSSAASLASAAPLVLLQTKYSRANEREADAFAIALMQRAKLNPGHLAAILARMEAKTGGGFGMPTFLSSHPATEERKAIALAKAPADEPETPQEAGKRVEPHRPALQPAQQEIATWLEKKDFESLARQLGGLQLAFEKDALHALALESAFDTFENLPDAAGATLDEWVQREPASYAARAARGRFLLSRGLEARRTNVIRGTPEESLKAMRAYLERARADLQASLALTPRPYASWTALLTIGKYVGDDKLKLAWYQEAVKVAPEGGYLRLLHMNSIEPRWGGSLAQMDAFAAQARAELKDPRSAAMVAARPPGYRGFERAQANDWAGALVHYEESLRLHEDPEVLCERAHALGKLMRHADAYADIRRALATVRPSQYCLEQALAASLNMNDAQEVIGVLNLVVKADPTMIAALTQRAWTFQALGRMEPAFQDQLAAAKLGDGPAQMQVGIWYHEGVGVKRDDKESLAWLEKALEQDIYDADRQIDTVRKAAGK